MMVLSYPALARVKLPISSPMDVYWTQKSQIELADNNSYAPEWLLLEPVMYFQQIILKSSIEPWDNMNNSISPAMVVKGALSRSFHIMDHINSLHGFENTCVHVKSKPVSSLLPEKDCIFFSPWLFWRKDKTYFLEDERVIETVFKHPCSTTMCPRDILLGAPTRYTGIKQSYQTNRHRSIEYAITVVQSRFDPGLRRSLIERLTTEFELEESAESDESIFVHVFYRPRKYFTDYFPLFAGYFLCMAYFYYTVSKFEMVKSKWGLAFAAFNTVFWTLAMTSGICAHFDLTPTLFGAGLYPYLAMIIGLENILCITRAVVYTTPSMDVASRLSHGLSHEGYNITKFFMLEMGFLGFAWLTFVPEIQEFCTFAFIALVVDFYMQLFFYIPCLLFDLGRLDLEEKQKYSHMLFNSDIRKLKNYPTPKCPASIIFPRMFAKKRKIFKTSSEANLLSGEGNPRTHRRTHSTDKTEDIRKQDTPISYRLRVLYFWTRTRVVQRMVMLFFTLWVLWLAFVVHKWKLLDKIYLYPGNMTDPVNGFGVSHYILDTAPLQWVQWQRQTFKWWPAVFGEYNLSLSGHYITFLPPIVLNAKIPPDDWSLQSVMKNIVDDTSEGHELQTGKEPELQSRITFLERQMTALLVTSMFLPFCFVVAFISYVFFWDRWRQYRSSLKKTENIDPPKTLSQKCFVELTPLLFSSHDIVVECVSVQLPSTIILTSLDGRVYRCGSHNGEPKKQIARWKSSLPDEREDGLRHRTRTLSNQNNGEQEGRDSDGRTRSTTLNDTNGLDVLAGDARAQIWCLAVKQNIILLGCADGSVEVGNALWSRIIGRYEDPAQTKSGVLHIKLRSNRMIIGRLNGVIEIIELIFSENTETPVRFNALSIVKAHQRPITAIETAGLYLFSSSYDRLIKIFDIRTMKLLHTLVEDDSPVLELKVDEQVDAPLVLYNRYESGLISCWDVESGELLRSLNDLRENRITKAELGITSTFLIAFSRDGQLFVWDKFSRDFLIRLVANEPEKSFDETPGQVLVVDGSMIVTSLGCFVQIWDLSLRALIRQIQLPNSIEDLHQLDGRGVLCVASNTVYRIDVPVSGGKKLN